ncbi:MAG: wax ester/triacylglycerol synthase family O-acyltransferase [Actinomycetota bacterium]|nr:wax ester/triacylglycerol synthase family O-acyltransferase [Actinomycetota bacterium]
MERLSGLDAAFLYGETPSVHMHVASAMLFDPSTADVDYSLQRVRDTVQAHLHEIPTFRQRLVFVPFNVHHPVWVNDPGFDLEYHIRSATLPGAGGLDELADFTADVISRPLDRDRPLWEMWYVDGLEDGHIAVVTKIHHAAIDGVSGREIATTLLDTDPDPEISASQETFEPEPIPSDLHLLARAAADRASLPVELAETAYRTVRGALKLGALEFQARRDDSDQPNGDRPPAPFTAPRTRFNASITPHRRVEFVSCELDDIKQVKRAFDVSFNDVVLAVCAGALRRYLAQHGELPGEDLVTWVPIAVRAGGGDAQRNAVSAMITSLATATADPAERLRRVSRSAQIAKRQHLAIGATTLTDWAEFAAPAMFARAARLYSATGMAERHRPLYNVVISNVPGPRRSLYFAGAELLSYYPMGPIIDGGALNISVVSYRDGLFFGLVTCRETVPDVSRLGEYLADSLAELVEAAPTDGSS